VNLWRGSNPDYNANKTVAGVALALKQFKHIAQQPQNTASSRARYVMFDGQYSLSEILYMMAANVHHTSFCLSLFYLFIIV